MQHKLFKAIIIVTLVALALGLAPAGTVQAATVAWVAQYPAGNPIYTQTIRVWMNSDTIYGEDAGVEIHNLTAATWTKYIGTYDAMGQGNWYVDIPALAAGTQVEYQLFVRGTDKVTYYSYTNFNWSYTVQSLPTTVYVNSAWAAQSNGADPDGAGPATNFGGDAFATIQNGINGVAEGGTVIVAASSSYAENVIVNKDITLTGADGSEPEQGTGATVVGNINVTAAGATVNRMKVTPGTVTGNAAGITVGASNVTLSNNFVVNINGNGSGSVKGISLYKGSEPYISNITLSGNHVHEIHNSSAAGYGGASGIMVQGLVRDVLIEKNRIDLIDSAGWAYGIEITPSGSVTSVPQNIQIRNNFISTVNPGLTLPQVPYPGVGVIVDTSGSNPADASQVTVFENAISNVPAPFANKDTAHILNASGNYPGYNYYSANLQQALNPANVGLVDYTPFFGNLSDAAPGEPGFQGNFSSLYVDDYNAQSGTTGRIQEGVDTVTENGTVNVLAGTYAENVLVNKSVTIAGESQDGVIVVPAVSNPNCGGAGGGSLCAGASNVFLVQANNVTIHHLTVDGDNPLLTSGIVKGGADLDARNGIITNHPVGIYNNLVIYNTTVKNIYLRGIYPSSGGSFNIHDNTVTNVRGELASIAIMNFEGAGIFDSNTVSDANDGIVSNWSSGTTYSNNTVTQSGSGIHTDNAGAYAGVADVITGNTISNCDTGGYGIWTYATYIAPSSIENNTITNCTVGMAAFGSNTTAPIVFSNNVINGSSLANSIGFVSSTSIDPYGSLNIVADFSDNQVTNAIHGVVVEAETGYSNTSSITGNTLTGADGLTGNGLWIDGGTLNAEGNVIGTYARGVNIASGSAVIGGDQWSEQNTFTEIYYGFEVTGGTLTVRGNTISSATTFNQNNGSLIAYANNISGFGTYARKGTGGTTSLKHNYWGSNDPAAAMPGGLLAADWNARLGASIRNWAEGDGSVSLLGAALSGTAGDTVQLVWHGEGDNVPERPFNSGIEPYASQMCSDFFDFFAVGGTGDAFDVTLPVDAALSCDPALNSKALFWIPSGTNYASECSGSDNKICWDGVALTATVTTSDRNLVVSDLTRAQLGGTQFVVGDINGLDPTAIELISLQATSRGNGTGWLFSLLGVSVLLGALLISRRKK